MKSHTDNTYLKHLHSLDPHRASQKGRFDDHIRLIAESFNVSKVVLSLINGERSWSTSIKSCPLQLLSWEASLYANAINPGYLEIPDMREDRFLKNHSAVCSQPTVRFYASTLIFGAFGRPIGALSMADTRPRKLSGPQRNRLKAFARIIQREINRDSELETERLAFRDSAMRDPTTGLPGEILLNQSLEKIIETASAEEKELAVLHLRLENLDAMVDPDQPGYQIRMVQTLVDRLVVSHEGVLGAGRPGPDRLVLVLQNRHAMDSKPGVLRAAKRILNQLTQPIEFGDRRIRPEINIGISLFPSDAKQARELIEKARRALTYPHTPRNIHFYDTMTDANATRRNLTQERLVTALENHAITLNYQPIWHADGSNIAGFEALARWNDPKLGIVSPGEFVPIAEKNASLSGQLTDYVLRKACQEAQTWKMPSGVDLPRIAVNIPAREFYQPQFASTIFNILQETGLAPDRLTLELTEESLVQDINQTSRTMAELSAEGIKLALDDFGTGYSSLNHLIQLPIDILKIDKSFIDALPGRKKVAGFLSGFIRVVHAMELTVVAEGVERDSQLHIPQEIDCNMVQGYLLGRPIVPEDIPQLLNPIRTTVNIDPPPTKTHGSDSSPTPLS